ncbi:hypothetical protein PBCV1_a653R [Paramecium bursaria Chlorella virus 1]|uniref:Uncharacterized protein n=1 Tax=Paramecium bursaria Chlorella virus 1 TaxID=10506 RepID=O41135_PBCV1|nr:hypothetical protein PBCV1_a653R [Paramecium bursaria Chlorella virus 1]AAC97038.1 hypothetical protein [Paramecium bursaria Chlorella virus 1]
MLVVKLNSFDHTLDILCTINRIKRLRNSVLIPLVLYGSDCFKPVFFKHVLRDDIRAIPVNILEPM